MSETDKYDGLMDDLVERLRALIVSDDHTRGCEGRQYNCTCEYDERVEKGLTQAADRIQALEARIAELEYDLTRHVDSLAYMREAGVRERARTVAAVVAMHDAINQPKGVVPESGERFYNCLGGAYADLVKPTDVVKVPGPPST